MSASTPAPTSSSSFDPSSADYRAGYAAGASGGASGTTQSPGVITTDNNTGLIVTGVVSGLIVLGLAYYYLWSRRGDMSFASRITSLLTYSVIVLLLAFGSWFIYQGVMGDKALSGNLIKKPIDGSTPATIPATSTPPQAGINGGNYGLQWWVYIKDWDTGFGKEKTVLTRGGAGRLNPYVYLHPTENSLVVKIDQHATTGTSAAASGDVFTCQLTNVPLQTWFAVGLSVSGRNVDLYLDGKLLRSCLMSGVPMTPAGNISVMSNGGFSGNVVDLFHYSRALKPADAEAFFAAGTTGTSYTANSLPSKSLFGYSVHLGLKDNSGKVIKEFAV